MLIRMITLIALVIVFLLLIWNFRSTLTPILALTPIVVGIVWTVGIIGLTLGAMNIFTMMIMVVLLGLGIDFSIHIISGLTEFRAAGDNIITALEKTFSGEILKKNIRSAERGFREVKTSDW